MTDSSDYRLYLDERFEGLGKLVNAQFLNVHERLEAIEKDLAEVRVQTTKTNGRVTELETEVHSELPHTKDGCPQKDIIEEMHDKIMTEEVVEKTDKERKAENRAEWIKWLQTIGIIIAATTLIITAIRLGKGQEKIMVNQEVLKDKQDNLGIPFVINKRGGFVALPDSTKIEYWGNDSMKYIIKRIK
jgi:hypothetical protein